MGSVMWYATQCRALHAACDAMPEDCALGYHHRIRSRAAHIYVPTLEDLQAIRRGIREAGGA